MVFDDATGHLHELSPVASNVLTVLFDGHTWTSSDLAESLLGELPLSSDTEMMDNVLAHFESTNLIERASS